MKNEAELNENLKKEENVSKPKRGFEISPEAQEERRLLSAFLLDKKEELIIERNRRKKEFETEKIELRNGIFISRLEVRQFVTAQKQPYSARFPNGNPFFKHMFRLHPHLSKHDPNKYEKPYLAGKLLKRLTYNRFKVEFEAEVLPALIVFAMPDGIRLYKCHEFLTPAGIDHFIRFRDEANDLMAKYSDLQWYDFLKEYSTRYKLVFQPRFF